MNIAQTRGATYFHASGPVWESTKSMFGVGDKGMWNINKAFLAQQIKGGATFVITSPSSGFFYAKEVAYVLAHTTKYIFLF